MSVVNPDPPEYVYREYVRRYRQARAAWAENPTVREMAVLIGMDEREYCDRLLATMPPATWTSSSTTAVTDRGVWLPEKNICNVLSRKHDSFALALPAPLASEQYGQVTMPLASTGLTSDWNHMPKHTTKPILRSDGLLTATANQFLKYVVAVSTGEPASCLCTEQVYRRSAFYAIGRRIMATGHEADAVLQFLRRLKATVSLEVFR